MFNLNKKIPKIICNDHNYFSPGDKIVELEEKIKLLEKQIEYLKEENIETTNILYELQNSIEAVDNRIDIITAEKFLKDV